MTSTQHLERPRRGAGLSGREIRRLVDLVLEAEARRQPVTALTRMIPDLAADDARAVRDELVRRRIAAGDPCAAIVAHAEADGEPMLAGASAVQHGAEPLTAVGSELHVRLVAGVRLTPATLRALLTGAPLADPESEGCLALAVVRSPFRPAESGDIDLLAANGGLCRVVVAGPAAECVVRRGDEAIAAVELPSAETLHRDARVALAAALERCAPLRELRAHHLEGAAPFPDLVLATPLGASFALAEGDAVGLEAAVRTDATTTATTDRSIPMGESR